MIKKLIKILLVLFSLIIIIIFYLSFIGIKTEKFNEKIVSRLLEKNKNLQLDLNDVKFLLNPYNFTAKISTNNPTIILGSNKLQIKSVKTNIFLKSLINNDFLIDDLEISTEQIKLNDLILFIRSFKNSTKLFLLDNIIKDGFLTANIKLEFDKNGNLREDYQANGFIQKANFNFFNQLNIKNLNLEFSINEKKYTLTKIETDFINIELSSPLIEVVEKNDLFLIKGKILTKEKNFNTNQFNNLFGNLFKTSSLEKARLSSINNFSFNINKKLKFNDLNIESKIKIDQLVVKNNYINLKSYLPSLDELINFKDHRVVLNYNKDNLKIKGKGKILIKDKLDTINYEIVKNNDNFKFDTKINLRNNKLLIDFLDYKKKENSDSTILIKGNFNKNRKIKFDLISLVEKSNKMEFKKLNLSEKYKIKSIESFNFDYINNNKIKNQLVLKKNNKNYTIVGKNVDATKLINQIMNNNDEDTSLSSDFNSQIKLKIEKTYINEVDSINNLSGVLNFSDNKIIDANLEATFNNNKKINLSIITNDKQEKITRLFTDYPKPLIKRYDFIKGFEEGSLDYYSIKTNGISNSLMIIDNFKVKKVPVFAKLLSLASLQGIADLLTGEGIRFTDFEMKFSNNKGLITIEEMYAIGPAVSILMDGYIETKKLVSLRGTIVPATTINRTIASIPLLGSILVGKKTGEGVFGVSFKIKGPPKNIKTSVNPIKTLTPRFITRTLEKIKKN
tara:strand:- start:721 stop:2919 length:2199 start_codon:yes stop_codon:yes gene_type:complete